MIPNSGSGPGGPRSDARQELPVSSPVAFMFLLAFCPARWRASFACVGSLAPVWAFVDIDVAVLDWDREQGLKLLEKVAQFGHRTDDIDPLQAFTHVRRIHLGAGESLISAGAPAGFVYIPEGEGLRGVPLGGYAEFLMRPWIPVGVTGVIRGSIRNADIIAEHDVTVLAIPRDVYVEFWHRTYDQSAFADHFSD